MGATKRFKGGKGSRKPLTANMAEAAQLAAIGMGTDSIAEQLGVDRSTVGRWLKREDVRDLRTRALQEVISAMVPKAYAVLSAQLNDSNAWVAQGAAREIIRIFAQQQGQSDASVVVNFGAMPPPGAPTGVAALESANAVEGELVD